MNTHTFEYNIEVKQGQNIELFFIHPADSHISGNFTINVHNKGGIFTGFFLTKSENELNISVETNTQSPFSKNNIYTFHSGLKNGKYTLKTKNIITHDNSDSNITNSILLFDQASAKVQSTPLTRSGKDTRNHLHQNIFLFGHSSILAIPELNTFQKSSETSHSCSIAKYSEEDIFFLQNKGFSRPEIQELFMNNCLDTLLSKMSHQHMKECLEKYLFSHTLSCIK